MTAPAVVQGLEPLTVTEPKGVFWPVVSVAVGVLLITALTLLAVSRETSDQAD